MSLFSSRRLFGLCRVLVSTVDVITRRAVNTCVQWHAPPRIFIRKTLVQGSPSWFQGPSPSRGHSRWSSVQRLFTDFDCRNDQNLNISHKWPVDCWL